MKLVVSSADMLDPVDAAAVTTPTNATSEPTALHFRRNRARCGFSGSSMTHSMLRRTLLLVALQAIFSSVHAQAAT
jgi:hypothetical protein